MIAELAQFWPFVLALITAAGGGLFAWLHTSRKAADRIAIERAKAEAAEARSAEDKKRADEAEAVVDRIWINDKKKAEVHADVANTDARSIRDELRQDWQRRP